MGRICSGRLRERNESRGARCEGEKSTSCPLPGRIGAKDIKGPFADIELLACGGVNAGNIGAYFACGASAVAFGGSVFRADWLAERRYERIGEEVRKLVLACRAARPGQAATPPRFPCAP